MTVRAPQRNLKLRQLQGRLIREPDKATKFKPLCNAFMLGKCTKGKDCPNYHPKALAARINKQVNKSIEQGINLLKKPTTVASGEASTQAGSSSNAKPKVQARPKKPGE